MLRPVFAVGRIIHSSISQDKDVSIISGVAEELRRKQDTGIATNEAMPMAQRCRECAAGLQEKFGREPESQP